jgi:hypothetical protein
MTQPVRQWPPKDPDAVLDYTYRIPLDPADSIAPGQAVITKLSGAVVIDSQSLAAAADTVDGVYGQAITVWLSGGTDGETALFQAAWTTVATRHDDGLVQLARRLGRDRRAAAHRLRQAASRPPGRALSGLCRRRDGHDPGMAHRRRALRHRPHGPRATMPRA